MAWGVDEHTGDIAACREESQHGGGWRTRATPVQRGRRARRRLSQAVPLGQQILE